MECIYCGDVKQYVNDEGICRNCVEWVNETVEDSLYKEGDERYINKKEKEGF